MTGKAKSLTKLVLSFIAAVIVGILLFASTRPDTFQVERSVTIRAPAERIFPLINDFHAWTQWSPYEKLDPAMKRDYSGAVSGKGAVYAWDGSGHVGAGRMQIKESTPPTKVAIDLQFQRPMETRNVAEFTLQPQGDATRVTWAMHGPSPFLSKVMHVFFNMDALIGKDFETGLNNLKAATER
jgi:uncharacterized protein YndB with AHSA1/START domain